MIKQKAGVVSVDDNTVWLDVERESTCSSCAVKQGCGTGMLAKHVGQRFSRVAVNKEYEVYAGQQVQLAIAEDRLLHGAFLLYILPLIFMFVSAILARLVMASEIMEVFAGIAGFFIGCYWVRVHLRNSEDGFRARIVEE